MKRICAGGMSSTSGAMNISAPDGVATIAIGGIIVYENGALVPGVTVPTDEGYLTVDGFDPQTGQLSYTCQLVSSTAEHLQPGTDKIAHDLDVVVTDSDGSVGSRFRTTFITIVVPAIDATDGSTSITPGDWGNNLQDSDQTFPLRKTPQSRL